MPASRLRFSILTQRVPGPREGTVRWLARSATTGDIGLGTTEDIAIERLFAGILALMLAAREIDGVSPESWLEAHFDFDGRLETEFERLEKRGDVERLPEIRGPAGIRLELRKARQPALA